jgi:lipopolysaccharide/colanic/teichoic acid biosynthesis glycosyltransferase
LLNNSNRKISLQKLIKRAIDIVVAITLLILLLPFILLAILAILILEGRPIFYVSRRLVKLDQEIPILKFRTMVRDAKSQKYDLHGRFMNDGYLDIPIDCEVYTGIGRVLERTQFVESLQLINVLIHGVSLIGNRPLPANNVVELKRLPKWEERFSSPAGMTGIAQVVGKFNLQPVDRMELESKYSRVYNEGNVLKCDLAIVFYTVRLLLRNQTLPMDDARKLLEKCM